MARVQYRPDRNRPPSKTLEGLRERSVAIQGGSVIESQNPGLHNDDRRRSSWDSNRQPQWQHYH